MEDLVPWQQLERLASESWLAHGVDPQFRVACRMPAGWYRIRFAMSCAFRARLEIFADTGQGLETADCIERMNLRGAMTRDFFVNIPRPVSGFRFDPVDTPGEFRLDDWSIEPVSRTFVAWKALTAAIRTMRCDWATTFTLVRNAGLLLRGRMKTIKHKLLEHISGPSLLAPPPYDPVEAYAAWRRRRQLTNGDRVRMKSAIAAMPTPPLISVIMLVRDERESEWQRALDSVRKQIYPHWELCIGFPGSVDAQTFLARNRDPRIKPIFLPNSAHRTLWNAATGAFIALMDPGDRLAEHALFAVVTRANEMPEADMIYSDEDFSGAEDALPFFKPDWSPEYLLSFPYTGRLAIYRTSLVRELGGLRDELGPAVEYDLALRIAAHSQRIEHVADVLYHGSPTRQRGPASLAAASASCARALQDSLKEQANVEPGPAPGLHRVRFVVGRPLVNIIIPTAYRQLACGGETFLSRCLNSIRTKSTYTNYGIVLLDNDAAPPELVPELSGWKITRLPYTQPFNWAAAINQGAALAEGEHFLVLDDDTEVITPDWIECLLEYSQQSQIGVVGARLQFPDGRLQHAGVTVLGGVPGHTFYRRPDNDAGYFHSSIVPRNWSAVTGACLMTRAEVFRAMGGFDESFGWNFNDIDYCLRVARAGHRIVCTPFARLYHHETATKSQFSRDELERFQKRWQEAWPEDAFCNPNLSKRFHDFRIEGAALA
jgi:glycosyltransferase involved in cell wall biosynthesis